MRGIIAGKALAYLENALKKKSGNPEARIADYFDVAAGAGVGGIFTAMLFASKDHKTPVFEAQHTWRFLADHAHKFYRPGGAASAAGTGRSFFRRLFSGNSTAGNFVVI